LQMDDETRPFVFCGNPSCLEHECVRCVECPQQKRLARCEVCSIVRCMLCRADVSPFRGAEKYNDLFKQVSDGTAEMGAMATCLQESVPNAMISCPSCCKVFCVGCMDDVTARLLLAEMLLLGERQHSTELRCGHCYWSTKPCTNPACPNEVGVPTKRCGDCHLDRYCSVECQVVAYPNHVARCERIQARRAAAGKE